MKNRSHRCKNQGHQTSDAPPWPRQSFAAAVGPFPGLLPPHYYLDLVHLEETSRMPLERRPNSAGRAQTRRLKPGASSSLLPYAPVSARHVAPRASPRATRGSGAPFRAISLPVRYFDIFMQYFDHFRVILVMGPFRTQWRSPFCISTH